MTILTGPHPGMTHLAAGSVLGIGALIQMARNEPLAPLPVPAVILTGVSITIMWRRNSDQRPHTRMNGTSANDG